MQTINFDTSLVSTPSLESSIHREFQSYQFKPLVMRIEKELGVSNAEALQLFIDLKTWMYMCTVSDKPLSPPVMIDEAWHNFVLFTREYADFCQNFCGRFVHHVPYDGMPYTETSEALKVQVSKNTKDLISKFGLSGKNWKMGSVAKCCSGGNCSNSPSGCSHCNDE